MMELLLNLAWLLLALPACWLWRRTRRSCAGRDSGSLQCLLALACALVVLFPVISATDDLRAMRTEMEETPASKRNLRQAVQDKGSPWNGGIESQTAVPVAFISMTPGAEHAELAVSPSFTLIALPSIHHAGRAPPVRPLL